MLSNVFVECCCFQMLIFQRLSVGEESKRKCRKAKPSLGQEKGESKKKGVPMIWSIEAWVRNRAYKRREEGCAMMSRYG